MPKLRPKPPRPDRRCFIRGSFSWIDHRFLREGLDQGLTRLEKLLYFVLVAVSIKTESAFTPTRVWRSCWTSVFLMNWRVARDLIAYEGGIYQVLDLPVCPRRKGCDASPSLPDHALRSSSSPPPVRRTALREAASDLESVKQLLERWGRR